MNAKTIHITTAVLDEILDERARQDAKWGEQNHPDGTGFAGSARDADVARLECKRQFAEGTGTWLDILNEEVAEAYAEKDPAKLRAELIQVVAVGVAWIEAIDRRLKAIKIDEQVKALEHGLPAVARTEQNTQEG